MQKQKSDPNTFELHKEMFKRLGGNQQRSYASQVPPLNP
jgi:hypothetical protein